MHGEDVKEKKAGCVRASASDTAADPEGARVRIPRQHGRVSVIALTVLALTVAAATAPEDGDERELLRARVEQVRDDPDFTLRGTALAARRVLPALYARREFTRTWTDPGAAAQLVAAIREVGNDGLDPEDYLLP